MKTTVGKLTKESYGNIHVGIYNETPFLVLQHSTANGFVSSKINEKRYDLFDIVNFPVLDSDILLRAPSGAYISQLILGLLESATMLRTSTRKMGVGGGQLLMSLIYKAGLYYAVR